MNAAAHSRRQPPRLLYEGGSPVKIEDLKARGQTLSIIGWTAQLGKNPFEAQGVGQDRVAAIEIDWDSRKVNITPASARSTFERHIAEISRLGSL